MCEPVSIGLAVAGASMAAQSAAQSSAAKSQNKYRAALGEAQNREFEQTVESVKRDIGLQTDALMAQRIEVIDQQKQELQNATRDARQSSATMRAGAVEAGVEGRSIDLLHQQLERDTMELQSAAIRNISNYTMQINREAQSIYSRGQSIINQGYPSPLPPPANVNYGLIAVNSATAGLNAGLASYSAFNAPNTGTVASQAAPSGGYSGGYGSLGSYPAPSFGWPGQ